MPRTFILLFLLLMTHSSYASVPLTIGTIDTEKYGFRFEGITTDTTSALFTFENPARDLVLSVTGFDIDGRNELTVYLNNRLLGELANTGDRQTASTTIQIPFAIQTPGTNTIEFRQRVPGWMWGITDVLLESVPGGPSYASVPLTVGIIDTAKYGFNFEGVSTDATSALFTFENPASDLVLSVTGFDIDGIDELKVYLNNSLLGELTNTGDRQRASTTIQIPFSSQAAGTNTLEFRQRVSGWMWGITDVLLERTSGGPDNDMELVIGVIENRRFGYKYLGVDTHRESAMFTFTSTGIDLSLEVTGFDIDVADEVRVFVNDNAIGFLSVTDNRGTSVSTFDIPAASQISGENTLEFRQRVPNWNWGITNLTLMEDTGVPLPDIKTLSNIEEYNLVFNDEFNAAPGSSLDATKWDTGLLWGPYFPINNEEQLYVDTLGMHSDFSYTPFEFTGSTLKITATPTDASLQPPPRPPEDSPVWQPRSYSEYRYNGPTEDGPGYQASDVNYLSGIITTYESLKMTHGYVEMRAKLPAGRGLWPAFWMLTTHYVEDVPEIDVMEFLGQDVDRIYHSYHYFDIEDNWRKISTPSFTTQASNWTESFHTFGMAWSPTEIIWYVNGEETRRITRNEYTIPNQAMYILANLAVGGNWPGAPDANTAFPATLEIDYIRAYKRKLRPELNITADYQLMFVDNFNGTELNPAKWNTHFLWGPYLTINNEEQYYVDSLGSDSANTTASNTPFVVNNGVLSITARQADDPSSFPIPAQLPGINDSIWTDYPAFQRNTNYTPGNYTSGIITSYDAFKFAHGYAEIRAKVPAGDGLWPAFWLLNGYYVNIQPEIDVMEVRGEFPTQVVHSYHRLVNGVMTSGVGATTNTPSIDYSQNFHTYGVRWQPERIDWYIDREIVHTYTGDDVGYQTMYVLANLAVGGDFSNGTPVDISRFNTVNPVSLDIDYIKVYQEKHKD